MMSLNLPSAAAPGPPGGGGGGNNSDLSPDFGFSSVSSTPAGSLSARPSRDEAQERALESSRVTYEEMVHCRKKMFQA